LLAVAVAVFGLVVGAAVMNQEQQLQRQGEAHGLP
jgi:hypothetical protein